MSGDVQPRKRKDKRKKKDDEDILQHQGSIGGSDEVIHIYKESKLGGNICSKIVFFCLLGALGVMVGLIIIEYHGTNDMETQPAADSPWSLMLEGWVDDPSTMNDGHDHDEEHSSNEDDNELDHNGGEHSESEHDVEEGEEIEGINNDSVVQKTYDDLRETYNQISPDKTEAEPTSDIYSNVEENETESEPELSEDESSDAEDNEEDVEDEALEDNPLGQWKSESGPDLMAAEVEEIQTASEPEEESEEESSYEKAGAQSAEDKETYSYADITNKADWEIRNDLDEADREIDDGDFPP